MPSLLGWWVVKLSFGLRQAYAKAWSLNHLAMPFEALEGVVGSPAAWNQRLTLLLSSPRIVGRFLCLPERLLPSCEMKNRILRHRAVEKIK